MGRYFLKTTIRFETDLTREGLVSLRNQIDQILALPTLAPGAEGDPIQRRVEALWQRIGQNSRRFLVVAAELGDYTMEDIAAKAGVSIEQVRAWHRNITRSLRHIDEKFGSEPPLFGDVRWDGQRNYYRMWMNVRGAIRQVSQ